MIKAIQESNTKNTNGISIKQTGCFGEIMLITQEQIDESKNGIIILNNHKDWDSLDQIPRGKYFPDYILNCESFACFYSSWFQGKNDAISLLDNNKKNVLINDFNKMDIMQKLYPTDWIYKQGYALEVAKKLNYKYDVVTCDSTVDDLYKTNFNVFYNITNKYLCLYGNDVFLFNNGFKSNREDISEKLSNYHDKKIKVKEVFKRPDSRGCLNYYWVIITPNEQTTEQIIGDGLNQSSEKAVQLESSGGAR